MQAFKKYLIDNFEQAFVLLILVSVASIVYFVPYKLSFLNFFYLPVLLSAYYLSIRSAVLGTVLTFIMVSIYAYLYPNAFLPESSPFTMWASIITWASFLVLTAVVVGYTHRKLQEKITEAVKVRAELTGNRDLLEQTVDALRDIESNMDDKVQERTQALEESTRSIEAHKEKVEEALYATMDPAVVKLMIDKRIRTENRRISVQFCDLKGFTQYSEEHSADVVITELNKYLADMEGILLQYNAHIDKYMGDGIMTEFGAPNNFDKHALLAVAAGWKMQQAMEVGQYPWPLRVGIATGVTTTGIIGSKRQTYTALGDTVNLASRIENLCEPGKVTVSEETYRECDQYFNFVRKTLVSVDDEEAAAMRSKVDQLLKNVEQRPEDIELRLEMGEALLAVNDAEQALQHFKEAMGLDPDNDKAKLAYAETAVKIEQTDKVQVKGRSQAVNLYEVQGIKDPLEVYNNIPQAVYKEVKEHITRLVPYPEDIVLPIECIDGSVGFSQMIGVLAYLIADRMDLADQDKHDILEAGYLAEIGKTIVPENVLNRRGSLSSDDFTTVHMHPREAVRKLKNMGYRNEAMLVIIECHHENFNGSGYPAGRKAEDIPLGARIVAVAEAYISLTSARPYRDAWEAHAAYQELGKFTDSGKFDPAVMKVLGELVEVL